MKKVLLKDWLKNERLKRGMTQSEFAKMIGVTLASISHYEQGDIPRLNVIKKISTTLDVDYVTLYKMIGD